MAILNGHEVAFSKPSFNTRNGTLEIDENGEYEVETYEKVDVDVSGGGKNTIPLQNIFTDIPCEIKVIKNA